MRCGQADFDRLSSSRTLVRPTVRTLGLTAAEYRDFVKRFGIEHRPAGGDPTLLMEISVEHKIFDKATQNKFRSWLDDLFNDAYTATEGCDVLIEAPSAFAGIHIAESRKIPYLRAFVRHQSVG